MAIAQAVAHAGAECLVVTGRDAAKGAAAAEIERSGATALFVEPRIRDERRSFPTAIAFERRLTG